jgi:transposase
MDRRTSDSGPRAHVTREQVVAAMAGGPDAVLTLIEQTVAAAVATAVAAALAPVLERLRVLEAAQAKDSHNSSKPPSSDVTRTGRAPKSLRGKPGTSGKRPGGQPGHRGTTLALRATPDVVTTHVPATCAHCGHGFTPPDPPAVAVAGERRQVFELPPIALVCTEHRLAERPCPHCGAWTRGAFPPAARATVQYGPGLLALGLYLTTQHLLPGARAAEVLTTLTGQRVSPATVQAAERRCAAALAPVTARILTGLARSAVLQLDETAFYVVETRGPAARWWLHVACTPTLTHYTAHPKRGTAAHAAVGLLPTYTGTAVHDGYASYATHAGCRHALCGVHLLRELTFLAEEGAPATCRWAAAFKRALRAMKRGADRARAAGAAALDRATLGRYRRRYAALLAHGEAAEPPPVRTAARGRPKRSLGAQLLFRLRRDQDAVLRFLADLAVPFDNSQAERDVRMMRVEQKISGGFRTPAGAATFCTNRGYLSTARKQAQHPLTVLRDALLGQPFMPAIP